MKKRAAIIGTGIAGMSAAYFLKDDYDITVYEKSNYIGGHTNTLTLENDGETAVFDSGFMVFNFQTYPLLVKLFEKLDVPITETDMSFSVQNKQTGLEYTGTGINGLFAQRRNLLRWNHYRFLWEVNRFNKLANDISALDDFEDISIAEFVSKYGFKYRMLEDYLIPMSSAVWSTPPEKMLSFSIYSLIRFFKNHGFLGLDTQYQWYTVQGGSIEYRKRLVQDFKDRIQLNSCVANVKRVPTEAGTAGASVTTQLGETQLYDIVIIAAHSDQAYAMLDTPTSLETEILPFFKYHKNIATVHTDSTVMPRTKACWSSWNFVYNPNEEGNLKPSTIYYMNQLQGVSDSNDYFVSINGEKDMAPDSILKTIEYHHPVFNTDTFKLQSRFAELNASGPIYFTGAYQANGFHEDGLKSSYDLCQSILGKDLL